MDGATDGMTLVLGRGELDDTTVGSGGLALGGDELVETPVAVTVLVISGVLPIRGAGTDEICLVASPASSMACVTYAPRMALSSTASNRKGMYLLKGS